MSKANCVDHNHSWLMDCKGEDRTYYGCEYCDATLGESPIEPEAEGMEMPTNVTGGGNTLSINIPGSMFEWMSQVTNHLNSHTKQLKKLGGV